MDPFTIPGTSTFGTKANGPASPVALHPFFASELALFCVALLPALFAEPPPATNPLAKFPATLPADARFHLSALFTAMVKVQTDTVDLFQMLANMCTAEPLPTMNTLSIGVSGAKYLLVSFAHGAILDAHSSSLILVALIVTIWLSDRNT